MINKARFQWIASALTGASAVALGAMGAHMLEDLLASGGYTLSWKTASTYHIVHAVVLLFLASVRSCPSYCWWLFFSGTWLFSGSIYLLCTTPYKGLGPVTPLGGVLLIIGWISLAFSAQSKTRGAL